MKRMIPIMLATVLALACAAPASATEAPIYIVTTTTMLTDLVQSLGGAHVQVEGLMGPGVDPHLYKASAQDVGRLQQAQLVVFNGLHLEGKMGDVFRALSAQGKEVLEIGTVFDEANLLYGADGSTPDPHVWFDVALWKTAADAVANTLIAMDSAHAADYRTTLAQTHTALDALDTYIRDRTAAIPPEQRILVTAHDAFGYFGRAYGFEVHALQGISTDAEAGTADVMALATFITERAIPAIFTESSISPKTIEALQAAVAARGFAVRIGGQLYADSLGDEASGHADYCATFAANIDTIAESLRAKETRA